MEISKKIEIARDYVASHKNTDVTDWQPVGDADDNKWLLIYDNLSEGVYGEVRANGLGDNTIEICAHHTNTGNPVIFEWGIE